jgi:hypothetical protein
MSQKPGASYAGSKKKKGKVPAHQNVFAFIHNPHSKMSDRIMESDNTHVCRRCHDKIEWRKQYRKYKPRTVLGKCNLCSQKRIKVAYHTICEPCSRTSTKAVALLAELNRPKQRQTPEENDIEKIEEMVIAEQEDKEDEEEEQEEGAGNEVDADVDEEEDDDDPSSSQKHYRRVCTICVKEPALLDGDEVYDDEQDPLTAGTRRLKLRERKTIERRQLKETKPKRKNKIANEDDDDNSNDENPDTSDGSESGEENDHDDIDEHEEDPFLQAVGGADKLLVGDAYQAMLLQRAAADADSAK